MPSNSKISEKFTLQIIQKAKELGACLAGIASVENLKKSPSHVISGKLDDYKGVGTNESDKISPGEVVWPENAHSAIVIAVAHPEEKPELDWWQDGISGGTEGNQALISINTNLAEWLTVEKGIKANNLPYFIARGGIFLKDAAVLAGLGCIGKNNLFVTPEFGPRIRLRAMVINEVLPYTGPIDFDPCEDCPMPCIKACPQQAFGSKIYSKKQLGLERLPARTGVYSRILCNVQMELDINHYEKITIEGRDAPGRRIRYCRACELACPVGKNDSS
jgi:epoxyqueuosine reductase